MANQLVASIYGKNSNSVGGAAGTLMGFPTQSITIQPSRGQTFNGVTMNSVIQLIPSGTVVNQPQYYSAATVSTLITASNA